MLFVQGAISSPSFPFFPSKVVTGAVLQAACSWRELEVLTIDATPPRSRIEARVVHRGTIREFIGFNRARHAVLEAAILATRTHLLPREQIREEYARLQIIVDKTAGPREREAMDLLTEYVQLSIASSWRPRRGFISASSISEEVWAGASVALAPPFLPLRSCSRSLRQPTLTARGLMRTGRLNTPTVSSRITGSPAGSTSCFTAAIPSHAGLGSGTQLGLAVARAIAELNGLPVDPLELARAVDPGEAVGHRNLDLCAWGIHRRGGAQDRQREIAPLLARFRSRPAGAVSSRCRRDQRGLSGEAEARGIRAAAGPLGARMWNGSPIWFSCSSCRHWLKTISGASARRSRWCSGSLAAGSPPSRVASSPPVPTEELVAEHGLLGRAGRGPELVGSSGLRAGGDGGAAQQLATRVRRSMTPGGAVFEG